MVAIQEFGMVSGRADSLEKTALLIEVAEELFPDASITTDTYRTYFEIKMPGIDQPLGINPSGRVDVATRDLYEPARQFVESVREKGISSRDFTILKYYEAAPQVKNGQELIDQIKHEIAKTEAFVQ